MSTITLAEAQAKLPDLIDQMTAGQEVVITRNDHPVARLIVERPVRQPRRPGNCQGLLTIVRDDDEHLKDWSDYLRCSTLTG